MVKKKDKVVKEPEPEPEPAPEPEPEPVVETPKKSDEPVKILASAGGQTWYVDGDGNKLED